MKWYHYIACFFAGAFLANFVPHFVQGISGNLFPTPFANPPGKGMSSPLINVIWGLINFIIAYLLILAGRLSNKNKSALFIFFTGAVFMSIMLSIQFGSLHK